jgi:hypothetical protein
MADVKFGADRPVSGDDGRPGETGQKCRNPLRNRLGRRKPAGRRGFRAPRLRQRSRFGLDLEEFGWIGHRTV